jgi:hypothetical protein
MVGNETVAKTFRRSGLVDEGDYSADWPTAAMLGS